MELRGGGGGGRGRKEKVIRFSEICESSHLLNC